MTAGWRSALLCSDCCDTYAAGAAQTPYVLELHDHDANAGRRGGHAISVAAGHGQ